MTKLKDFVITVLIIGWIVGISGVAKIFGWETKV